MIYLDNAATTMLGCEVKNEISSSLERYFANPSALYREGYISHKVLEEAREKIAKALCCTPSEVYFTATGTEANNIAILGSARAKKNFGNEIILTRYEHPSVINTVNSLKNEGFLVHQVNPDLNGIVDTNKMLGLVNKKTALVTVMQVNNEIGSIIDVVTLAESVKSINNRTAFHCDMIQGFLKYPIELQKTKIDTASISAHKIHGPKGIGAIYIRKGFNINPIFFGGNQEKGIRSGTENVIFANAFGKAAEIYETKEILTLVTEINMYLREKLAEFDNVKINSPLQASKYILNFSMQGYKSETLIHFLDSEGIMVSAGASCSKGALSNTLLSMGIPSRVVESSIRVSFSKENTKEDIDKFIKTLKEARKKLVAN